MITDSWGTSPGTRFRNGIGPCSGSQITSSCGARNSLFYALFAGDDGGVGAWGIQSERREGGGDPEWLSRVASPKVRRWMDDGSNRTNIRGIWTTPSNWDGGGYNKLCLQSLTKICIALCGNDFLAGF